jgi:hypothetical protein
LKLAGLRNLRGTRDEMWAAGSMLTVTPVMIIYSFASRYFIRGIAITGWEPLPRLPQACQQGPLQAQITALFS